MSEWRLFMPVTSVCGAFFALLWVGRMLADGVVVVEAGVSIPNGLTLDPRQR